MKCKTRPPPVGKLKVKSYGRKEYLCNASDMPKLDKENPDDTYKQLVYEKLYLVDGEWSLEESEADN